MAGFVRFPRMDDLVGWIRHTGPLLLVGRPNDSGLHKIILRIFGVFRSRHPLLNAKKKLKFSEMKSF